MSDVVQQAKQALEGVPEGPWRVSGGVVWREDIIAVADPNDPTGQTPMPQQVQEKVCDTAADTAPFIAESRDLVPELIAEVERLNGLLASSADEIKSLRKRLADKPKGLRGW